MLKNIIYGLSIGALAVGLSAGAARPKTPRAWAWL